MQYWYVVLVSSAVTSPVHNFVELTFPSKCPPIIESWASPITTSRRFVFIHTGPSGSNDTTSFTRKVHAFVTSSSSLMSPNNITVLRGTSFKSVSMQASQISSQEVRTRSMIEVGRLKGTSPTGTLRPHDERRTVHGGQCADHTPCQPVGEHHCLGRRARITHQLDAHVLCNAAPMSSLARHSGERACLSPTARPFMLTKAWHWYIPHHRPSAPNFSNVLPDHVSEFVLESPATSTRTQLVI